MAPVTVTDPASARSTPSNHRCGTVKLPDSSQYDTTSSSGQPSQSRSAHVGAAVSPPESLAESPVSGGSTEEPAVSPPPVSSMPESTATKKTGVHGDRRIVGGAPQRERSDQFSATLKSVT
jgi:hypothetical protein